jgi:twinkle protein
MKSFSDYGIEIPAGRTGEVATTCPKCSGTRKNAKAKCLSANTEKSVWKCNHCSWTGTLLTGEDNKSNPFEYSPKRYHKPNYNPVPETDQSKMIAWFATRGIPGEVVANNKITTNQVWMPQVEAEVKAIQFPYFRDGECVNIKSRDHNKNFRMESGAERIFYGMDLVEGETLIIVEGEIDKLSIETAGFKNCVSVPDGAPSPNTKDYNSKFSFLESCEEWLKQFTKIILAVDADAPGKKLEEELCRRLGRDRCYQVQWPEGIKDANELLLKHDSKFLAQVINDAFPYPVQGLFSVKSFLPQIKQLYEDGMKRGALSGWGCLNEFINFSTGQWTVVTGIPGHGKSEFLDALMVNLAHNYGWKFAIFSPENQPLAMHFQKLSEKYIGKPFWGKARMEKSDLAKSARWIDERFSFVLPEPEHMSVDSILDLAKTAVNRNGIKGLVIDPWNELDHSRSVMLTETEYISQCLSKIRRFARDHNVHVFLVAHPTKLKKEKDDSGKMVYMPPTPYDISGSSHWRNKADNAITVFRVDGAENSSRVQIHVQKVRFKNNGKIGIGELKYEYMTGRFIDPESELPDYSDESNDLPKDF